MRRGTSAKTAEARNHVFRMCPTLLCAQLRTRIFVGDALVLSGVRSQMGADPRYQVYSSYHDEMFEYFDCFRDAQKRFTELSREFDEILEDHETLHDLAGRRS